MAELNVITAIKDPEFEAMVAGTLFSHGWSILFRALDVASLQNFLTTSSESRPLLIYSSDVSDLDSKILETFLPYLDRAIGFLASNNNEVLDGYLARPRDEIELLAMIRSPRRAPMLRSTSTDHSSSRCRMIALSGVNHGEGVTLTALNLAIEIGLTGKKVLLIDAHHQMPAIATLLGERHANKDAPKDVSAMLQIFEITRHNASHAVELIFNASHNVDFILIDLGLITYSEPALLDRRWESAFLTSVLVVSVFGFVALEIIPLKASFPPETNLSFCCFTKLFTKLFVACFTSVVIFGDEKLPPRIALIGMLSTF